ncbi:MAG: hypothetical protein WDM76_03725 [Limisphaerales bacterium]
MYTDDYKCYPVAGMWGRVEAILTLLGLGGFTPHVTIGRRLPAHLPRAYRGGILILLEQGWCSRIWTRVFADPWGISNQSFFSYGYNDWGLWVDYPVLGQKQIPLGLGGDVDRWANNPQKHSKKIQCWLAPVK